MPGWLNSREDGEAQRLREKSPSMPSWKPAASRVSSWKLPLPNVVPRRLLRPARRRPLWIIVPVLAAFIIEVFLHVGYWKVPKPEHDTDKPFFTECQEPDIYGERENAVLVMLARNSELQQANSTVRSVELSFNQWYKYPIVFMNDEEFSEEFINTLNATAGGRASFEVIPHDQWTFPHWVDEKSAKKSIRKQGLQGIPHADSEGYHHMCRFYSGKFYELPALRKYRWYWRLEPDVDFSCAITYDPFVEMAKRDKVYGFTIALWEVKDTCPSLFRAVADWQEEHDIEPSNLWRAMISASWVPYPFRRLMSLFPHRTRHGDVWSLCHYWSNFEIADMDFFRSSKYLSFFDYLDKKGGFYFERWGDAPVHSLAVAMYLEPHQVHHFEDFGYRHDKLFQCPANAPGGQLPNSQLLNQHSKYWMPELKGGVGCRCQCDGLLTRNHPGWCLNKLKQPNTRKRPWFTWLL